MEVDVTRQPAHAKRQPRAKLDGEADDDQHDAESDKSTSHDSRVAQTCAVRMRTLVQEATLSYTVILEREADGGFVASVPALPGCVSQGDSRQEALLNIREAIELYIEDCREAGDPVPEEAGREYIEVETKV